MNLKPSDLPLLVSLDMLLEERNVTRAASKLHLSQPALSAQLARLRLLFNDRLLVPSDTGRGMVPTPKAQHMASTLREALTRLDTLGDANDTFDPERDRALFRVGGSFSAISTFAKPLIRTIHAHRNGELRLAFRAGSEELDVNAQFESGEIDILLVPAEQVPPFLKVRPLIADRMVMIQRRGHPRGQGELTVEGYCSLSHMVVSSSGRMDGLMDQALKDIGMTRHVAVSAPNGETVGAIIASTDLVCTLPQSMVDTVGPGIEAYAIPLTLPDMSLAMAWHSRLDRQPAHRWLRDTLVAISRDLHPTRHAQDAANVSSLLERKRVGRD